jgi:hypothetical protein
MISSAWVKRSSAPRSLVLSRLASAFLKKSSSRTSAAAEVAVSDLLHRRQKRAHLRAELRTGAGEFTFALGLFPQLEDQFAVLAARRRA